MSKYKSAVSLRQVVILLAGACVSAVLACGENAIGPPHLGEAGSNAGIAGAAGNPGSAGEAGSSGKGNAGSAGTSGDATFAVVESTILAKSCALSPSCHRGERSVGQLQLDGDRAALHARLVGKTSRVNNTETLIVAGNPTASYLYRKITGDFSGLGCVGQPDPNDEAPNACGRQMPFKVEPLPEAKMQLIKAWIQAGALNN